MVFLGNGVTNALSEAETDLFVDEPNNEGLPRVDIAHSDVANPDALSACALQK